MKQMILTIRDSNMSGDLWEWNWELESTGRGDYSLHCMQTGNGFETLVIPSEIDLKDGVDVYVSLERMIEEAGYSIFDFDISAIANAISTLSLTLANHFKNATKIIEEREEEIAEKTRNARNAALAPFASIIEQYILQFSDEPLRGGGMSYGTRRLWIKKFIEEFVVVNGCLPKGKHHIKVASYNGSVHDFDDLSRLAL